MFRALLQFSAVFGFVLVTGIPGAAWSGPRYVDRAVELHDRCSLKVVGDPGALGLDWSALSNPLVSSRASPTEPSRPRTDRAL